MFHPEHRDHLLAIEVPDEVKPNQSVRMLRGKGAPSPVEPLFQHKGYSLSPPKEHRHFQSFKNYLTPFIYHLFRDSETKKAQNLSSRSST